MIHPITQDTMATDPAETILAAGWPRAARWRDATFHSALPATGAPFGRAQ